MSVALGERDEVLGRGSYVDAGYEDESAAEDDGYLGLVVPDEVGEKHTRKQLGVVVLGDVGCRSVLNRDVEAERSGGTEQAHGEESDAEAGCKWCGMEEHKCEAGNCSNQAGEERQALGRFGAGEDAGPDHVHREAGYAEHAGGKADPIDLARLTPGVDGDDHARKPGDDSQRLSPWQPLVQKKGGEQSDDHGRDEDEDVKHGERKMAQGDDDADVVAQVQAGADQLPLDSVRAQGTRLAAHHRVGAEKYGHEQAEKRHHLIDGKTGLADELDGRVGHDPEGETGKGEADGAKVCDGRLHRVHNGDGLTRAR